MLHPQPGLGLEEAQDIERPRQEEKESRPPPGIGLDYEAGSSGPPERTLYEDEQEIELLEQRLAEERSPNPEPAFGGDGERLGQGVGELAQQGPFKSP